MMRSLSKNDSSSTNHLFFRSTEEHTVIPGAGKSQVCLCKFYISHHFGYHESRVTCLGSLQSGHPSR